MTEPSFSFDDLVELSRKIHRERPAFLVSLEDYERVRAAAAALPVVPEVLVSPLVLEGQMIRTTMGMLESPFPVFPEGGETP